MNKNSNIYIIIYSTVMVVVVAAALAFASLSLKDKQNENVRIEKMGAILNSIGQGADADKMPDKATYIEEQYEKYIVDEFGVNTKGEKIEGVDAFSLLSDLKAEYEKPETDRVLPVFISRDDEGNIRYVFPVTGTGLWGPIWGYLSLNADMNTIFGASFDHKGETPGLGAEINTLAFSSQFNNKEIFDNGNLVAITVLKGSGASAGNAHAVDAISGGTITSRGVENMLKNCLKNYSTFIEKMKSSVSTEQESFIQTEETPVADTLNIK